MIIVMIWVSLTVACKKVETRQNIRTSQRIVSASAKELDDVNSGELGQDLSGVCKNVNDKKLGDCLVPFEIDGMIGFVNSNFDLIFKPAYAEIIQSGYPIMYVRTLDSVDQSASGRCILRRVR